jgi:hypothetical protein
VMGVSLRSWLRDGFKMANLSVLDDKNTRVSAHETYGGSGATATSVSCVVSCLESALSHTLPLASTPFQIVWIPTELCYVCNNVDGKGRGSCVLPVLFTPCTSWGLKGDS